MQATLAAALVCAGIAAGVPPTLAANTTDDEALRLAEMSEATPPPSAHDWRATLETASVLQTPATAAPGRPEARARVAASVDIDHAVGDLRAVLSNRLDFNWAPDNRATALVNTLKQAYLRWQPEDKLIAELGRINVREGVALGFNPTDFFKVGALRATESPDPHSLRENRQGSVMARAQVLWADGSATALVSPRLAARPSAAAFSPDLGATNDRWRAMIGVTHRLAGQFAPRWLLYGGEGLPPLIGVNTSAVLDDATTGYVEAAVGHDHAHADLPGAPARWHARLAAGLTRTFADKFSLTVELDHDGTSADRATWAALRSDPARLARYLGAVRSSQSLMSRTSVFAYASIANMGLRHLDLTLLARVDPVTRGRFAWIETRYHWPRTDLALGWQFHHGPEVAMGRASRDAASLQAAVTWYF